MFLTLGMVIPLTIFAGILVTFGMAGPVHRMEGFLRDVVAGKSPRPCSIRKGDEFQELCDLINQALEATRKGVGSSEQNTEDVDAAVDEGELTT